MRSSIRTIYLLGLTGLFSGLINGLLGIGGGTILIPALVFGLGEQQHIAHGTSLAVVLPTAVMSAFIYYTNSSFDLTLTVKVASSGMIGGYIGARLMTKIPALELRKLFSIFMFLAGLRMVLQ